VLTHLLGDLLSKPLLGELHGVALSRPEGDRGDQAEHGPEQTFALLRFDRGGSGWRNGLSQWGGCNMDGGGRLVFPGDNEVADCQSRAHAGPGIIADETPPIGRRFGPFDHAFDILVEVSANLSHSLADLIEFRGCGRHVLVSSSKPGGAFALFCVISRES
jgi:hypothetical protein